MLLLIRQFIGTQPISILSLNYQHFSTIIFSHTWKLTSMLPTCSFNVSLIYLAFLCGKRLGVLILIWWNEFINLLIKSLVILPSAWEYLQTWHFFLPGYPHFAPFMSLFMCIWCCQHSISNCCHLFHMSIPCCHWFSSIPSLHFRLCGASPPSLLKRLWTMFKIILLVFPMR